jgi:hypothetical protein
MQYKAVYQNGCAVFGIGQTEIEAIKDAREWVDDIEAMRNQISEGNASNEIGKFEMITITEEAKEKIEMCGGHIHIEENENGIYSV